VEKERWLKLVAVKTGASDERPRDGKKKKNVYFKS